MSDDPKISGRYRELPREEPPRALDDAILAASRRAVDARPAPLVAPTGRRRWYVPVAAAAVITLAVAVTLHVQHDRPSEEVEPVTPPMKVQQVPRVEAPRRIQKPAAQPFTPEPPRADSPASAAAAAPARPASEETRELRAQRDEIASAGTRERAANMQGASAPAPAAAAGKVSVLSRLAQQSPEQWLQGIADLRRQGRHDEADKELAEFRKRYPDYRIAPAMLEKVERSRAR